MEFERAAAVLDGVVQAPAFGIAAPVVFDDLAEPGERKAMPQSRLRAARSWLHALGYLSDDTEHSGYDVVLHTAIADFQRDAGLRVDGWMGEAATWPRLQELIAFEHPFNVEFWEDEEGEPKPALIRAVRTRLRLYGQEVGTDTDAAIRSFFGMMESLGAPPEGLGLTKARWLAGVLDHDRHVSAVIAGADLGRVRNLVEGRHETPEAVSAVSVVLNLAKIELWLAQQESVEITRVFEARLGFDGLWVIPSAIRQDIRQYMAWLDDEAPGADGVGRDYRRALRRGEPIKALTLFLSAAERFGKADDPFAPERLEEVHQFYGGDSNAVPRRAEVTAKRLSEPRSFRARLWDGVRRIWSWLRRALRRAIETGRRVLKLARDIAAYVFRAVSEGLAYLTQAITSFTEHVHVAADRQISDPRQLLSVARQPGRDVDLVARSGAPVPYVTAFMESLNLSAQIFRRASSILGRAVGLGVSLAGMAIAAPLVLRTLIAAVRDIRGVLRLLREIDFLQARHRQITATLARL